MLATDALTSLGSDVATEASGGTNATLGRDEFLQMLIAQLENQDPLNPQDSTEFTAQLAQFSSLEQLISIEDGIAGLAESQGLTQRLGTAGLIGQDVIVESSQIPMGEGGPIADPQFVLAGATSSTTVTIFDGNGLPIRVLDQGALGQGEHEVVWDGNDASGQRVPPGIYGFSITALSGEESVESVSRIRGRVTGSVPSGTNPLLLIGDLALPLSRVEEISEPRPFIAEPPAGVTP